LPSKDLKSRKPLVGLQAHASASNLAVNSVSASSPQQNPARLGRKRSTRISSARFCQIKAEKPIYIKTEPRPVPVVNQAVFESLDFTIDFVWHDPTPTAPMQSAPYVKTEPEPIQTPPPAAAGMAGFRQWLGEAESTPRPVVVGGGGGAAATTAKKATKRKPRTIHRTKQARGTTAAAKKKQALCTGPHSQTTKSAVQQHNCFRALIFDQLSNSEKAKAAAAQMKKKVVASAEATCPACKGRHRAHICGRERASPVTRWSK
jgi:hypothetical protein